jgi:DNA topoisomerase-1
MAKTAKKTTKKKASTSAGPRARSASSSSDGKNLVVVESPAKAKTINRYLGSDYTVKASMGHVRDLPKRDIGVDIEHDFAPTYEPLTGRRKVLAELKKSAKNAPQVYLATDLDREGEAIAWHLAESLGVPPDRIRRVIFNEITASAIKEAFSHPRDIDLSKVNAQQARRILDRIVGYQVSPLLWRKVATGLSAGRVQSVALRLIVEREREIDAFMPDEHWRIGGVFTAGGENPSALSAAWREFLATTDERGANPTREQQQAFLAERQAFRGELVGWRGEKFRADQAEQAVEVAKALGLAISDVERREDPDGKGPARNKVTVVGQLGGEMPDFTVRNIRQRETRSKPPAPFTTAVLQQAASNSLRFSASRTMRVAQQLYEGITVPGEGQVGLITYMRTDSRNLSNEAIGQIRGLIGSDFGDAYLPAKPNFYAAGQRAQEAHEAIRPTNAARHPEAVMGALTDEQYKLYRLIWQRTVASQMTPAVWKVTDVDVVADTAAGEAVFKAVGRTLAFDGFMRVTGVPKGGDQILPALHEAQPVAPLEISPTQHFTQPPPRYSEASLVKAMESEGIGRPSTYANIIQTILDRSYVRQEERIFFPTDLGTVVCDKLVKHFPRVFDVKFTAHMENELDKVEEDGADWVAVLREFYGPFHENLEAAAENMVHAKAESQPSEYTCEKCGSPMVYKFSKNGRYLACSAYPECKSTHPVDEHGKKVERKETDIQCPECGANMMLRRSRFGPFLGCSNYPECKTTMPCDAEGVPLKTVKAEEIEATCEACGAPMAVKFKGRSAFLGCSRYPECKTTAPMPEGVRVEPPPKPKPEEAGVNCPKCGKAMLIRIGKRGKFIACSGFPRCRNAMDVSKLDELKAAAAEGRKPALDEKKPAGKKKAAKKTSKKATRKPPEND